MSSQNIKCIYKAEIEDEDFLMSPCFDISPDTQLREVPTNGEEYLLKVIKERQKIPVITTMQDYSKFVTKQQTWFIEEVPKPAVLERLKPTKEWQNIQVADFSDTRMHISRISEKNNFKRLGSFQNNLKGWKNFFSTRESTLSCVLGLQQKVIKRGLIAITEILKECSVKKTIDKTTGQWIYAFMACMQQPLYSDNMCILRDVARQCAEIRSRINEDDENAEELAAPMNLFICLVGRYFGQHDLAD